jgi:hypothetical protein
MKNRLGLIAVLVAQFTFPRGQASGKRTDSCTAKRDLLKKRHPNLYPMLYPKI